VCAIENRIPKRCTQLARLQKYPTPRPALVDHLLIGKNLDNSYAALTLAIILLKNHLSLC